jgi:type II secretory pathway pseudopilin PulG
MGPNPRVSRAAAQPGSTGFTLVEALVVVIVGLLILAGVHRVFVAGLSTQHSTSVQTEVNRKAQVALDAMVSRVRGSSGAVESDPNRIWFIDQNGDNVRYWVTDGTLYEYRAASPGKYSDGMPLATSVSRLAFEYFNDLGQPAATADDVSRVVVELAVARAAYSARLRSSATLRNK